MSQLDEKLAELHSEREELEKFQKVDRQRRSLEFTIYDREVSEAAEKLAQVGALCQSMIAFFMVIGAV